MTEHIDNQFPVVAKGEIGGDPTQTVNARDLHAFLGVKSQFRDWIKNRISDFGFVENQDFVTVAKNLAGGGKQNDYFVTLDMAKELSMVERNEQGKRARQYFIECERRAKEARDPVAVLNDPEAMRGLLLSYSEKVLALESKVKETQPKADFYDQFMNADGLYGLQNAARALDCRPNLFIRWLKENFLFYQGGNLVARVQYIQMGVFEVKTTMVDDKVRPQAFVTPKGLKYLGDRAPGTLRMKAA